MTLVPELASQASVIVPAATEANGERAKKTPLRRVTRAARLSRNEDFENIIQDRPSHKRCQPANRWPRGIPGAGVGSVLNEVCLMPILHYRAILLAVINQSRCSSLSFGGSNTYHWDSGCPIMWESIQDRVSWKGARNRPTDTFLSTQDTLGRPGESW